MSSRPNPKHWEIILDYFEKNPDMVSGRAAGPNAKHIIKEKWETLATRLNSLGYTNKSSEKWLKTWTDFKSTLKKKAAEIRKDQKATGGGPPTCKQLNDYEERALQLLGTSFIGLNMPEAGLNPSFTPTYSTQLRAFTSPKHDPIPSTSTETPEHTPRVEKRQSFYLSHDEHNYMKRKKNENLMDKAYEETILVLRNIEAKLDSIDHKMGSIADSIKIIAEKL